MIESDLEALERAKTIGFSCGQFRLVVQALHHAAGKLLLRTKPIQQKLTVTTVPTLKTETPLTLIDT